MAGILEYLQLTPFQPKDLLVVISLVILEGLLSCDNAVALALLVRDLPPHQQSKALRYGIIGAYVFRIIAILAATWIIRQWYLKALGGLYLLWVAGQHFFGKKEENNEDPDAPPATKQFGKLSVFWSMVILVELTDIAFSVDSIAASVALSNKIWVLIAGGMLGILAMRFAAQAFILLLQKFPSLEGAAFAAVAFIGLKLLLEMPLDVVGREAQFAQPPTYTTVSLTRSRRTHHKRTRTSFLTS
ncbi:MAG: TerC family protein [Polyangiaceae bacterium]